MSKILLTLENINNYIVDNQIIIEKNMLLSSSVKDYLAEKGIEISYGKKENKDESLELRVKRILEKEFKVVDTKVVELVLKRISEVKR